MPEEGKSKLQINQEIKNQKYKRIVGLYLIHNGNITHKEISDMVLCSVFVVKSALDDYLRHPDKYKLLMKVDKSEFYNINKQKYDTCKKEDTALKLERGIKTMEFWAEVYNEKKKRYHSKNSGNKHICFIASTVITRRNSNQE